MISATTLRYAQWRTGCVERLGGKCIKCGFTDARALQFDHIKGGIGRNRPTGWKRWKWLNEAIERGEIQLLCANCNMIKKSQSEVEIGGCVTWASHTESMARRKKLVEVLTKAGFEVPHNRRSAVRCTTNTIPPAALAVLQISHMELSAVEIAYALIHFGWKFGAGKIGYEMGPMTVRTALVRRTDLFEPVSDGRNSLFKLAPFTPRLEDIKFDCGRCGHVWFSYLGIPPSKCPKCKKRLEGV